MRKEAELWLDANEKGDRGDEATMRRAGESAAPQRTAAAGEWGMRPAGAADLRQRQVARCVTASPTTSSKGGSAT